MIKRNALILLLVLSSIFCGCRTHPKQLEKPGYDRPLMPGQDALRKITNPLEIPDFTLGCIDVSGLRASIDRSLHYLSKPSSQRYFPVSGISHDRAVRSLKAFGELLDSGLTGPALNSAIRDRFDVYTSVGCDDRGTVLFTGYYTPIFDGSLRRGGRFQYALYKQPLDLVKNIDGDIIGRRGSDGSIGPYPPRAVIENSGMLAGNELVWLGDKFEAYIAHVQGSAKIRLEDGSLIGVGYAASNGGEYSSISKKMVADRVLSSSQMSLSAMIAHFKSHPDQVERYTRANDRFVFFKREDGPARGSLNEPVTEMRTIATDKSIFPRGCMAYICTSLPMVSSGGIISERIFSGFMLDQDAGGAIRAPGRCDIYMGEGETAGKLAGRTCREGHLYYLFLK